MTSYGGSRLKTGRESPGQTIQATALVHEAYMRCVQIEREGSTPSWNSRGHFFAAAAEAMRRILVERAREKKRLKHGGGQHRQELGDIEVSAAVPAIDLVALDIALDRLDGKDAAQGSARETSLFRRAHARRSGAALGISRSTADADWAYAKTWLRVEIEGAASDDES